MHTYAHTSPRSRLRCAPLNTQAHSHFHTLHTCISSHAHVNVFCFPSACVSDHAHAHQGRITAVRKSSFSSGPRPARRSKPPPSPSSCPTMSSQARVDRTRAPTTNFRCLTPPKSITLLPWRWFVTPRSTIHTPNTHNHSLLTHAGRGCAYVCEMIIRAASLAWHT